MNRQNAALDQPHFRVLAHAANNIYMFSIQDVADRRGSRCTGQLPTVMDAHGAKLVATVTGLQHITNSAAIGAIINRFGFDSRTAAKASGKKAAVSVKCTDAELVEIARTFAVAPPSERLVILDSLRTPDRNRYQPLIQQLGRFESHWEVVASNDDQIQSLAAWSQELLRSAAHDGPVYSRRYTLEAGEAA